MSLILFSFLSDVAAKAGAVTRVTTTPNPTTSDFKTKPLEDEDIICDIMSETVMGMGRPAAADMSHEPVSGGEERGPDVAPAAGRGKLMYVDVSLVAPEPAAGVEAHGGVCSEVKPEPVSAGDTWADPQPAPVAERGQNAAEAAAEDASATSEFVIKVEPLSESDTDTDTEAELVAENDVTTLEETEGTCASAADGDHSETSHTLTVSHSDSESHSHAAPKSVAQNALRRKEANAAERPFRCRECGATFKQSGHFNAHRKIHTGEKPYFCTECGSLFRERSHLRKHMIIHTGEKPFACKECGDTFARPGQLKSHTFRKHFSGKTRSCQCQDCPAAFFTASDLKRHGLIHTGEKPFACSDCTSAFKTINELKAHRRIHTGEKPHLCHECDASFAQSSQLKKHKLSKHSSSVRIRPYPCPDCTSAFVTKFDLANHKRIHTGEKPFKCRSCLAVFSQASALKTHTLRKHSPGIRRPFPCAECTAAFFTRSDLKEHHRVHTGGRKSV